MPETTKRVNITLTFATDAERDHVMRAVMDYLPDHLSAMLETVSVHDFDLDEPDADKPVAYLVIADDVVQAAGGDLDAALSAASACQGVVVEVPVVADHRKADR